MIIHFINQSITYAEGEGGDGRINIEHKETRDKSKTE